MSIIFQANKVSLFSDTFQTLAIQDQTLEAYGEYRKINGAVQSIIGVDKDKNTWIFTVPTWEYVLLNKGQHVHIEGPQNHTENGATYVCLRVCNTRGAQALLTMQISSRAQLTHNGITGEELDNV